LPCHPRFFGWDPCNRSVPSMVLAKSGNVSQTTRRPAAHRRLQELLGLS
jgi:hypothetical protein